MKPIISVSLGSSCVIEFTNEGGGAEEQFLEAKKCVGHRWRGAT